MVALTRPASGSVLKPRRRLTQDSLQTARSVLCLRPLSRRRRPHYSGPSYLTGKSLHKGMRSLLCCSARSPGFGDDFGNFQQEQPSWLLWQFNALQRGWVTVLGLLQRVSDVLYPALQPYNVQYTQVELGVKVVSAIVVLLVIRSLVSVFLTLAMLAAVAYTALYFMKTRQSGDATPTSEGAPAEPEEPVNRNRGRFRRSNAGSDFVDVWYEPEKRK
uniref:Uncharacterized protein n=1 Tax=Tetraselmis chuii TaxID=63592 RepID=A0A6U1E2A5_9CHLO|mmetsp:Transcript_11463/g.20739  ORF Transcript_11463/g.20739 Transcript_11463/m.20739 type:complete len:217 (+) Transcript_11463:339-989(+)